MFSIENLRKARPACTSSAELLVLSSRQGDWWPAADAWRKQCRLQEGRRRSCWWRWRRCQSLAMPSVGTKGNGPRHEGRKVQPILRGHWTLQVSCNSLNWIFSQAFCCNLDYTTRSTWVVWFTNTKSIPSRSSTRTSWSSCCGARTCTSPPRSRARTMSTSWNRYVIDPNRKWRLISLVHFLLLLQLIHERLPLEAEWRHILYCSFYFELIIYNL